MIADALRGGPTPGIILGTHMLDGEADDFANDISNALHAANWPILARGLWTRNNQGVFVAQVSGAPIRDMDRLYGALTSAGIKPSVIKIDPDDKTLSGAGFQPGFIYILVGRR